MRKTSTAPRFAEVRGHTQLRELLQRAATDDRLPHALLFAGAEGIGKRRFALALTAWLECPQRTGDACGECPACRQVAAGTHPDVKLVAIAENKKEIGVDRAREIKRFVQLRPTGAGVKVALIDDAQSLNIAAQNALLKTLEDPPNRSIIIMVANNPDALLPTVRSRCRRINFQPLAGEDVCDLLVSEHDIEPARARQLAELAEGSPGRALELQQHLPSDSGSLLALAESSAGVPYVELMSNAAALASPEDALATKLEILLTQLRDAASSAARAQDTLRAATLLRRAQVVAETADTLRHRTPNKQLLIDQLMIRLARA